MSDIIFIEGLSVYTTIGVYEWEQKIKQQLIFDVEMLWCSREAAKADNVDLCLNYAEVSQFIINYVQNKPFLLIERVAYEVAEQLRATFNIQWVSLKVSKPRAVAQAKNVGIKVEMGVR